jgi:hypothetical protein
MRYVLIGLFICPFLSGCVGPGIVITQPIVATGAHATHLVCDKDCALK